MSNGGFQPKVAPRPHGQIQGACLQEGREQIISCGDHQVLQCELMIHCITGICSYHAYDPCRFHCNIFTPECDAKLDWVTC